MPPNTPRRAALLAAVLGGAGAVAAEVVFTRRLAVLFGVTAPAAATVVGVYLLGMALGSVLGGQHADRLGPRAAWLYVGAELFGFMWAFAFPPLAGLLEGATAGVPAELTVPAAALGTALLVGPAAVASGATFPALSRLIGDEAEVRRIVAANAAGAALGSLGAGFVLPHLLGLSATLVLAGSLLVAAAGLVLFASRGHAPTEPVTLPAPPDPLGPARVTGTYAVLGASGMIAEIGWTRLLEQTGPNPSAVTFPLVLSAYLVGLALGGGLLEPRLRRLGERRALALCAGLSGGAAAVGLLLVPLVPAETLMGHAVGLGPGNVLVFQLTGIQVSADRLALYLLAAMLPGVASGAGLPIAASAITRAQRGLGRAVGGAWAAGTTAAVAASLWMGFLPAWGPGTVRSLATMGVVCLAVAAWTWGGRRVWLAPALGALAWLVPPHAGLQIQANETVLAFVESAAGPSAVTRQAGGTESGAGAPVAGGPAGAPPGPPGTSSAAGVSAGAPSPGAPPGPPTGAGAPLVAPVDFTAGASAGAGAPTSAPPGTTAGPAPGAAGRPPDLHWIYTHGERVGGFALDFAVPMALHPAPRRTLLIAFGTGVNVPRLKADPGVEELVVVDIDRVLPRLAENVPQVGPQLFDGARARFVNDDGRHYLRAEDTPWDVIYSDVATYAQYVELGTVDFFTLARSRLAPDGIFALKVHTDTLSRPGQARFLATFLKVFPDAVLFDAHGPMPILVGFATPPTVAALDARAVSARETYGEGVRERLLAMAALDADGIRSIASGPVSTDDRRMPLSVALVGPYGPGTYDESGQDVYFDAIDRFGRPAGEIFFGVAGLTPKTSVRPTNPPVPPTRRWWWGP